MIKNTGLPSAAFKPWPVGARLFRCDRCYAVFPESQRVEQDGFDLCLSFCADATSAIEQEKEYARAQANTDSFEPQRDPIDYPLSGAVGITSWSPERPTTILRGATATITIAGFGLSSSNAIAYDHAGLTTSSATYTGTTALSLVVACDAAVPVGLHTITYAGTPMRGALNVK